MGDFAVRALRREGRRAMRGWLNVRFSAFHEGRGAGKRTPVGGHDLVNRKKIVNRKEKLHNGTLFDSGSWLTSFQLVDLQTGQQSSYDRKDGNGHETGGNEGGTGRGRACSRE